MQQPNPTTHLAVPRALGVALLLGACVAPQRSWNAGANTPATAQRATFAKNTSMTAPGTLELEAGAARTPGREFSAPMTLKYGVDRRNEAYVGFTPYRTLEGVGNAGLGDLLLGWRQRFAEQSERRPSLAWLAALKLPSADDGAGLGSGELDAFGALSGVYAIDDVSAATVFLQLGLLGESDGGGVDAQPAFSLVYERGLASSTVVFGELEGVFTPDQDDEQVVATLGGLWSPVPGLVLDSGFGVGLSSDAPGFRWQLGVTRNLGPVGGWAPRLPRN